MGREKERQLQAEDDWKAKARAEGHTCGACGVVIEYDDREIYFDTGFCGRCNHTLNKDD